MSKEQFCLEVMPMARRMNGVISISLWSLMPLKGIVLDDRSRIRRITLSVSSDLSPLPFRPEDFIPENPFVKEILEKGVTIV